LGREDENSAEVKRRRILESIDDEPVSLWTSLQLWWLVFKPRECILVGGESSLLLFFFNILNLLLILYRAVINFFLVKYIYLVIKQVFNFLTLLFLPSSHFSSLPSPFSSPSPSSSSSSSSSSSIPIPASSLPHPIQFLIVEKSICLLEAVFLGASRYDANDLLPYVIRVNVVKDIFNRIEIVTERMMQFIRKSKTYEGNEFYHIERLNVGVICFLIGSIYAIFFSGS
jgi:hypothetical protein